MTEVIRMVRKTDDKIILSMLEEGKLQKEIAEHFGVSCAAICKRVKRLLPKPETFSSLTEKEQKFVMEVTRGNKTKTNAALAAFDCSSRESAKSIGIELAKRSDIGIAMNEMLQQVGLTRRYRAKKIKDHVDSPDPGISLKALDQTHKIDGAYAPEAHIHAHVTIDDLTRELKDLDQELAELDRQLGISSGKNDPIDVDFHEVDGENGSGSED